MLADLAPENHRIDATASSDRCQRTAPPAPSDASALAQDLVDRFIGLPHAQGALLFMI
jgi:hypothetical protein